MRGNLGYILSSKVGDNRDAEHAHIGVASNYNFGNGGHAYGIASDYTEIFIFGRGFKCRAGSSDVYTVHQAHAFFLTDGVGQGHEFFRVRLCHGREARAELFIVFATQRIFGEEVDVVGDYHHVAYHKFFVHTSCRIGYEQGFHAEFLHNTDRESDCFHVISLIVVETALHCHHAFAAHSAEDKIAAVTLNGRHGEVRYFGIRDIEFFVDMVHERTEPRAEDNGNLGHLAAYARAQKFGCLFDFFEHGKLV